MEKRLNELVVMVGMDRPETAATCVLFVDNVQVSQPTKVDGETPVRLVGSGDWPAGHYSFSVLRLAATEASPEVEQTFGCARVSEAAINGIGIPLVPYLMMVDGMSPPVGFEVKEPGFNVAAEISGLHAKLDEVLLLLQGRAAPSAPQAPAPSIATASDPAQAPAGASSSVA